MVAVIEIDLGVLGVHFPRGEVALVVAQPFVDIEADFIHEEPFTWTEQSKARALECIDTTLAVSLMAPQGVGKTHFTVFPECMLPGLEGVDRVTQAMQAEAWPVETVVVGGVDGLTRAQFVELVQRPNTTHDAVNNGLDLITDDHWVNCSVTWAKLPSGEVRSWVQPKLSPARIELDVTYMSMYRGRSIYVFKGRHSNVAAWYRFATLLCFDWIAKTEEKRVWEWLFEGLTEVAGPEGAQIPLTWLFVAQCNAAPSHASFMGQVPAFFEQDNYPQVNRDETCLVMANVAGKAEPGRANRFGQSAVIFMPSRFSAPDCMPTYCNGGPPGRPGAPLENLRDALFRESGACIHSFLVTHPSSLPIGSAGHRFPLREAMVHPLDGKFRPRTPGGTVPAVVKWVNDELDDPSMSLAFTHEHAALRAVASGAHVKTVDELRNLQDKGLDATVRIATARAEDKKPKKRSPDDWDAGEGLALKHVLHTFSILDVAQYPSTFHGRGAHATVLTGESSIDVIAIRGASHEDCDKHVLARLPHHTGRLLLVSRDEENTSWDARFQRIYDQVPDEPSPESKFTEPTSAIMRLGYRDVMDAYRGAANEAELREALDAKLS